MIAALLGTRPSTSSPPGSTPTPTPTARGAAAVSPIECARSLRPLLLLLMTLMGIVALCRVAMGDLWAAVTPAFVAMMGFFVTSGPEGLDPSNALFYAIIAGAYGCFDLAVYSVHLRRTLTHLAAFGPAAPTMLGVFDQATRLMCPVLLFATSVAACFV